MANVIWELTITVLDNGKCLTKWWISKEHTDSVYATMFGSIIWAMKHENIPGKKICDLFIGAYEEMNEAKKSEASADYEDKNEAIKEIVQWLNKLFNNLKK